MQTVVCCQLPLETSSLRTALRPITCIGGSRLSLHTEQQAGSQQT